MPPSTVAIAPSVVSVPRRRRATGERLNDLLLGLGAAELATMAEKVARSAYERGAWKEVDGRRRAVPVTLRPRLVSLSRRGYLHHVAWQLRLALTRLGRLRREVPEVADALPLGEGEAEWLQRYGRPGLSERLFCRLDAVASLERRSWRESLTFLEPNVVGIGGMRYAAAAEEALLEHLGPLAGRIDPELVLERNADPRGLLCDELLAHARGLGCGGRPSIVLVDDSSLYRFGGEMAALAEHMRTRGLDVRAADVRALGVGSDGSVVLDGRRVDVVFRYLDSNELSEIEAQGDDLAGMRRAFETGRVVPGASGDLEHKSAFEVMTDPRLAGLFSPTQRRVLAEHVPWTRLLSQRHTTSPDGRVVDLAEWVARQRPRLVIKPNRSFGGDGVVLGEHCDDARWHAALADALARPGSCVVQLACTPCIEDFPRVERDGRARLEALYTTVGLYPSSAGLGVLGRVAHGPVVNLSTGGSVSPFLVEVR